VGAGEHASNSADNPASEQGVEHSAILPEAGGEDSAAVPIVNLIRWRARTNRAMLSPDVGRLQGNLVAADRAVPIEGDT
jgi:hypothetical protein